MSLLKLKSYKKTRKKLTTIDTIIDNNQATAPAKTKSNKAIKKKLVTKRPSTQ